MSWCPKCKNEYRAGITVCPDCNEELIEELTESIELDFVLVFQTTDEELKEKLIKYLNHCGHKVQEEVGTVETEDGIKNGYAIFVPKKESREALREIQTVLSYDAKQEEDREDLKPRRRMPEVSNLYVDAKSRYSEYKSTGIMFLVFAFVFFVFGIMNISGIVTIMASNVSLIILFAAAAAFTYVGVTSLNKISSLKEEVSTEEKTTDSIMNYLKENCTKEQLLSQVDADVSGELLYFQLTEIMKEMITSKFPEEDENYLDALLEEYYNSLEIE